MQRLAAPVETRKAISRGEHQPSQAGVPCFTGPASYLHRFRGAFQKRGTSAGVPLRGDPRLLTFAASRQGEADALRCRCMIVEDESKSSHRERCSCLMVLVVSVALYRPTGTVGPPGSHSPLAATSCSVPRLWVRRLWAGFGSLACARL